VTYVSYARLPQGFRPEARNEACPIPCDLAIEIISPDQSQGELTQKAQDYLKAGVLRVWVIDPETVDITVFFPDGTRALYTGDTKIIDTLLPGLELSPQLIFEEAELL
jgi:Uma2 family endonuclease